jgi:hypothetical protein
LFEESMESGTHDRGPGVMQTIASAGSELNPRHLAHQLAVAVVSEFTRSQVTLEVAREPVGIPDDHIAKLLGVALSPRGVAVRHVDGRDC